MYNESMNKTILTDCDGVILDWEWAFRIWMQERGYKLVPNGHYSYYFHDQFENLTKDESKSLVRTFNESAAIGFLPALRDAAHYVKRLHEEHGYKFHLITSLSKDQNAQRLREMNVKKIFGPDTFEKFIFLDTGGDKDEVLLPYKESKLFWIEDKPENADVGHNLGLRSILMEHGHNMNHNCSYPVVKNWKEIYNIIIEGEKNE